MKPNIFFKFYDWLRYRNKTYEEKERFTIKYFIPSVRDLVRNLLVFKPNVVIMREGGYSTILGTFICRILFVDRIVLYTQMPQYVNSIKPSKFIVKLYEKFLLPHISYTPVKTAVYTEDFSQLHLTSKAFIPFVMKFKSDSLERGYLIGGKINLLDVGKYRDYKNHFILLNALSRLSKSTLETFRVTIIGQMTTDAEKDYCNRMKSFVTENNLVDTVTIKDAILHTEMPNMYLSNDVFILTSKRETASVSVLEAMSYGLVCISTSHNGTATYVGENGFVFDTDNVESLVGVLNKIASLKEQLPTIGKATFNYALQNYNSDVYCNLLEKLCSNN